MLRASYVVALVLIVLSASVIAESEGVFDTPKKLDTEGFQEIFAQVGDNIFVAGQPSPEGLERAKSLGVSKVVNLRTDFEMNNRNMVPFDEAAKLEEMGIDYVHIPLGGPDTPYTPAAVKQLAQAIDSAEGGVLLHCTVAFRATHLWSAYLIAEEGVPFDEAIGIARELNLGGLPLEGFLDKPLTIVPAEQ